MSEFFNYTELDIVKEGISVILDPSLADTLLGETALLFSESHHEYINPSEVSDSESAELLAAGLNLFMIENEAFDQEYYEETGGLVVTAVIHVNKPYSHILMVVTHFPPEGEDDDQEEEDEWS